MNFIRFHIEGVSILMTHIGGKPERYSKPAFAELQKNGAPALFICGHSHITLVKMDKRHNMLWMNPGACGFKGFHQVKTILRFCITEDRIHDLELIELGEKSLAIPIPIHKKKASKLRPFIFCGE